MNGKLETLRDGKTSVFLCEPKTFDFLNCETENQDSEEDVRKKIETTRHTELLKNENARSVKFDSLGVAVSYYC